MGEAPALFVGQALDVEREQVDVVGARSQPGEELGALADMKAALHARVARAESSEQPRPAGDARWDG